MKRDNSLNLVLNLPGLLCSEIYHQSTTKEHTKDKKKQNSVPLIFETGHHSCSYLNVKYFRLALPNLVQEYLSFQTINPFANQSLNIFKVKGASILVKHPTTYTGSRPDATVDIGTDNKSAAMCTRSGYLTWFACQKLKHLICSLHQSLVHQDTTPIGFFG